MEELGIAMVISGHGGIVHRDVFPPCHTAQKKPEGKLNHHRVCLQALHH